MNDKLKEKRELIEFFLECQALQFGSFTLKSGRVSPYFFNSARFDTGLRLKRLGEYYARAIAGAAPEVTIVFGPAYKGIPLCTAAAAALGQMPGRAGTGYLFNRKEAKGHGDKGMFVGRIPGPQDRLVLVDDVITDGETKWEAVQALRESFAAPLDALVIALDRMEQDPRGEDAVRRFEERSGVPVVSLLTLAELEEALLGWGAGAAGPKQGPALDPGLAGEISAYRKRYGVRR
ncbi:MAG: orotate phosphoribosyltransferase [Deltaproteobacteria bacterium]|nr:orotate phosphoribosyltransferase [Deltaproteobacteria bacterium]